MGLFDDAGIDEQELNDLDTGLKDGKHPAVLTDLPLHEKTKEDGTVTRYQVFEWTVENHDWPVKQFFEILPPGLTLATCDDTDDSFNVYNGRRGQVRQTQKAYYRGKMAALKRQYESLGIPEERMNTVSKEDLKNLKAVIETTRNKQGYAQIDKVSVPGASGTSLPKPPVGPVMNGATASVPDFVPTAGTGSVGVNPFAKS
jgi:hypothetical protein